MSQNRLARSSTPGVSALQKTISKRFLLPSYIVICFLFLFSEKMITLNQESIWG